MYQNLFPGHNKITKQILLTKELCHFIILIPWMNKNNKICYSVILLACYSVILMDQITNFVILINQNNEILLF